MKRIILSALFVVVLAFGLCACTGSTSNNGDSQASSGIQTINGTEYQTMRLNGASTIVPLDWIVLKDKSISAHPSDLQYPVVIITDNTTTTEPIAQTCNSADEFQEVVQEELDYLVECEYEFEEPTYTSLDSYPYKAEVKYSYGYVDGIMIFESNESGNAWLTTGCIGTGAQDYEEELSLATENFVLE